MRNKRNIPEGDGITSLAAIDFHSPPTNGSAKNSAKLNVINAGGRAPN